VAKIGCLGGLAPNGSCRHEGRNYVCTKCNEQLDCSNGAGQWCDPELDYYPTKLSKKDRRKMRRAERRARRRGDGGGEYYCEDCEVASSGRPRRSGKFWDFLGKVVEVGVPVAGSVYLGKLGLENCTKLYDTYSTHKSNAGETIPAPNCQGNALGGFAGFNNPWSQLGAGSNIGLAANIGVQGNLYSGANMGGVWPQTAFGAPGMGMFNSMNGMNSMYNPNVYANANGAAGAFYQPQPFGQQWGQQPWGGQQWNGNTGINPWAQNQMYNPGGFYGNNFFGPTPQDFSMQRSMWNPGRTIGGNYNPWGQQFYNGSGGGQFPGGQQQGCIQGINC
jgi:hypothetical protein